MTVIDHAEYRNCTRIMFAAVRLGIGYGLFRYGIDSKKLTNRPPVMRIRTRLRRGPAGDPRRARSGRSRLNRCRNSRVRWRSGTGGHHVGDVPRDLLGIVAQDEVREDLFERTARQHGSQLLHGVVCDDAALVEHDDARAELVRRRRGCATCTESPCRARQDSRRDGAAPAPPSHRARNRAHRKSAHPDRAGARR